MSSSNSPCAACKFLRRKCTQECVFAPYFPADNPHRFACVHRVFGASNVAKLLNELSASQREDAVKSLAYEAEARLRAPVYGCVGFISVLQQKLRQIQNDLHGAKKELSTYLSPQAMQALQAMLANPNMVEAMLTNPNMIPSTGMIMPNQFQANAGFPNYGNTNLVASPLMATPHNQLMIHDPQHELLEAQQLAAAQQQRELMLRNYEQQQQEFIRFGGFEQVSGGGSGDGLNQMDGGDNGGGVDPARLALCNFDNVSLYHMQQHQLGEQQQQQQQHHTHNYVPHSHTHPVEAQQLLSPQQHQPSQQQHEGGE